jgi:hypothetical protein
MKPLGHGTLSDGNLREIIVEDVDYYEHAPQRAQYED